MAVSVTAKLYALLDPHARRQFCILVALVLVASLLEVVGVGMALPFIRLLQDPESLRGFGGAAFLYDFRDRFGERAFVIALTAGYFTLVLAKNAALGFIVYFRNRFLYENRAALSKRLYRHYLHAPYEMHLRVNTAEMLRNATGTVGQFTNALYQISNILIETLTFLAILAFLLFVSPYAVAMMALFFGGFGAAFVGLLRRRTTAWGRQSEAESLALIKWLNQGLNGIKEIRILGREAYFDRHFADHADALGGYMLRHNTANEMPRLLIEVLMIGGICTALGASVLTGENLAAIIPLLGLFAVAGLRLMPSANRLITSYNGLKFTTPAVDILYAVIGDEEDRRAQDGDARPAAFAREIRLRDVIFGYEGRPRAALRNIDLAISRGERVGVTGPTGAGKTTLVDLIMGMHRPDSGQITIDDTDITGRPAAFRGLIGYVPQQVHLIDDTLTRNIALGREDGEIDGEKVLKAVALASLGDLVDALPDGLDTVIGEGGVRLSGGQRQRIGIARALYDDPDILVLDEATSALDYETEERINCAIESLAGDKTIIVIAHRLSTVKACDRILFMREGAIEATGDFETLLRDSAEFRNLVAQMSATPGPAVGRGAAAETSAAGR